SAGELLLEPGMSSALAVRLLAALELGRRVALAPASGRPRLLRAQDVASVLWSRLAHLPHEEFWTVLMNARLQEIRCVQIARGGLTQCSVSPREAFAPALVHRAPAIVFVHNHLRVIRPLPARTNRCKFSPNRPGTGLAAPSSITLWWA